MNDLKQKEMSSDICYTVKNTVTMEIQESHYINPTNLDPFYKADKIWIMYKSVQTRQI